MNVYETAEKLAKEIQNLDIYKTINETRETLKKNPKTKPLLDRFEKLKVIIQDYENKKRSNQLIDLNDQKERVQEMYDLLTEYPEIKEFFDYEVELSEIITNINNIIGEVIKDVI